MANTSRNNRLYNYLVNHFGLSKEIVMEYVETRLADLISKHIETKLSSNYVEHLILNRITKLHKDGIAGNNMWDHNYAFDRYVKAAIRETIVQELNKEYEVAAKLVKKDAKIIATPLKVEE